MRHNGRAPLLASAMRPEHLNLREGEPRMAVCPDCQTWHRLQRSMIKPHRSGDTAPSRERRYYGDKPSGGRRCPGSAQRITIDITAEQWGEKLLAADGTATGRRSARQHYKPLPASVTPVTRIKAEATLETTRQSYLAHRKGCIRCADGQHCTDGGILARRYVLALNQEPARRDARQEQERQERRTTRKQTAPAARKAQWAQYGGKVVETANNRCASRTPGSRSGGWGPQLPLGPKDAEAHERRQAALHARKDSPTTA